MKLSLGAAIKTLKDDELKENKNNFQHRWKLAEQKLVCLHGSFREIEDCQKPSSELKKEEEFSSLPDKTPDARHTNKMR